MRPKAAEPGLVRLFLAGDVMLGRGIDQILPNPGDPQIYESWLKSAVDYVRLAEEKSGSIPRRVSYAYVWGDLLDDLASLDVDFRLINLETAVTKCDAPDNKSINYRMHPDNVPTLTAARIDACVLANNHVIDWGREGLLETLATLKDAGISTVGAGYDRDEAARPLVADIAGGGRVLVLAFGSVTSGVPDRWGAGEKRHGINMLPANIEKALAEVRARVEPVRTPGDLLVVSVHWGGNWGYDIPADQRALARALIDEAGVDLIFGHSSHHPKAIERYNGKLILYGSGDLINDYEGIGGFEEFRPDLGLGYVVDLRCEDGKARDMQLLPYRRHRFRLERADDNAAAFLREATGWA